MHYRSLFFGLLWGILTSPAFADGGRNVVLAGSVKGIDVVPAVAGAAHSSKAYISRRTLSAAETNASLTFEVALKMRNFAELQGRVAKGERVSRDEMAARFAPTGADFQRVVAWLTAGGFTVVRTPANHLAVFARGRVGQIAQAMKVSFARVTADGTEYTSAISAPSIPAALAPTLVGINGLQPHIRAHADFMQKALAGPQPYVPSQISAAYQATSLYADGITGSGQTIAIVDDTFVSPGDLLAFWKAAKVNQSLSNIEFVQAVAGNLNSPSEEASLDVEWASSMAPGAHVRVYGSGDFNLANVDEAYAQIYEDVTNHPELGIHEMSMSYGTGEATMTSAQAQAGDQYFAELAAAGVTMFAASGDNGVTVTGDYGNEDGPLEVSFPASDPNVTGVGGTTLTLGATGAVASEVAWNVSSAASGVGYAASGGGVSIFFDRPTWQAGSGVGIRTMREVPDVAAAAYAPAGGLAYVNGQRGGIVGTSWACPIWAAFCALDNETRENAGGADLGVLGPEVYPLLSPASKYAANFRDITEGNNGTAYSGGYFAGPGYDMVTGLGVPRVTTLAQTLAGTTKLAGIGMPPAFIEVEPGQNASFAVAVKGASATYQWQSLPVGGTTWSDVANGTPFGGATTATLTVTKANSALSGDEFRCVVTMGAVTVTTSPPSALAVETPLTISTVKVQTTGGFGFRFPSGIAFDNSGNLYIADFDNDAIDEVTPTGTVTSPYGGYAGNADGIGNEAGFNGPNAVAFDGNNTLYVADTRNNLVRTITLSTGQVSTLAGTHGEFNFPNGVAVDSSENIYVANQNDHTICKVTQDGTVTVFAGQTGVAGYADGNGTTQALFNFPYAVAVDGAGNVYVADHGNSVVRKITPSGMVSTVAGMPGVAGYRDGAAGEALFNGPFGVTVDASDNIYVADCGDDSKNLGNDLIRKISPAGAVTTLAGGPGTNGTANGVGSAAQFQSPQAVAINSAGMMYIADTFNQTIRLGMPPTPLKVAYLSGVAAELETLPGVSADGNVVIGAAATSTLTISNIGTATLNVTGIHYPTGFSGNWSSGAITVGGTQAIVVTFSPAAATSYGGPITVTSDAGAKFGSFSASGAGIAAPSAGLLTAAYGNLDTNLVTGPVDFGTVWTGPGATPGLIAFWIKNPTDATLAISSITFPPGYSSGDWSSTIPAGKEEYFHVYFNPKTVATYAGNIVVNSDFVGPPLTIPVTGLGSGAPTATTGSATIVSATSAILNGTVTPNNSLPSITFEYGPAHSYSFATTPQIISGASSVPISGLLTGLMPETVYDYRIALNGSSFGAVKTFTTPIAQYVSSSPAAYVGAFNARLVSTVNAGGLATQAYFQYGTTTGYGSQTAAQSISGTNYLTLSQGIAGLSTGTTYHFRMVMTSSAGTVYGPDQTFTSSPFSVTEVAATGDGAPGTNFNFASLGSAAVNAQDGVAFGATLAGASAGSNAGIWANRGSNALNLIAQTGSAAPGAGGAVFATLTDPVYNNNADVAFGGSLKVTPGLAATANGVWASNGGTLGLIAREGSPAPGAGGALFASFSSMGLSDSGGVIVAGTVTGSGVTAANNSGIWEGTTASNLALMLRTGEQVEMGKTIASFRFLPMDATVNGQTRGFGPVTGHLIANVTYTDKTTGIVEVIKPMLPEVLAMRGDESPFFVGTFSTFSSSVINDTDYLAFAGTVVDTSYIGSTVVDGIWADNNTGQLIAEARKGDSPRVGPAQEIYESFGDPVYNDNEALAFQAIVNTYASGKSENISGVFATNLNLPATVALQGGQAPGCAPGVTFSSFGSLALPNVGGAMNQGGVTFLATLSGTGVTAANNTGIFAEDDTGAVQLIVRTGDVLIGKTITALSFLPTESGGNALVAGQTRSFSAATGDLVYNATFSDKSQAIFNVVYPP